MNTNNNILLNGMNNLMDTNVLQNNPQNIGMQQTSSQGVSAGMQPTYEQLYESNASLKKQIDNLQKVVEELQQKIKQTRPFATPVRKASTSANKAPNKENKKDQTPPNESTSNTENLPQEKKIPVPPPIFVSNVKDFSLLRKGIVPHVSLIPNFTTTNNGTVKIKTHNEDDYRIVASLLKEIKTGFADKPDEPLHQIEFYSYELKQNRRFCIVIRGLHPTTDLDDIKKELEGAGYKVANIINLRKKIVKNGKVTYHNYPLHRVELFNTDYVKEVYNINQLLYCKVKIEQPHKKNIIPQCINCQQLGHTKNFCMRNPKCVKCAQNHHTSQCDKTKKVQPTCALCGASGKEGHPANYKGCPVYQKKMSEQLPKKQKLAHRIKTNTHTTVNSVNTGQTYASVAANNTTSHNQNNNQQTRKEPTISDLMDMLTKFQSDVKSNFGQLTQRVCQLENQTKQAPSQTKKNQNG